MLIDYAIELGIDILAIFLLAYVLYFRRHQRADLLLAYVSLNIGTFMAMFLLGSVRVELALGFGLFAILSIVRLRSSAVTQQEVAYYFIALVMGLANGLDLNNRPLIVLVNGALLLTMLVVDSSALRDRVRRLDITLDTVHTDEAALVADLEHRLGGKVTRHEVNEIDHSRGTMLVDVRYRTGSEKSEPAAPERRTEVVLDLVHPGDAAMIADLERRLGGRVLHHRVNKIDYVRDITVVDVRCEVVWPVNDPGFTAPGSAPGVPQPRNGSAPDGPAPSVPWPRGRQRGAAPKAPVES